MTIFEDMVNQYFAPLAGSYGMEKVSLMRNVCQFESAKVYLRISYDDLRSYEINVSIGEISSSPKQLGMGYSLSTILRLNDAPEIGVIQLYEAPNHELNESLRRDDSIILADVIEKLFVLTNKYAAKLLSGNEADFIALRMFHDKECVEYAKARLGRAK
jgi:hypothetical protein